MKLKIARAGVSLALLFGLAAAGCGSSGPAVDGADGGLTPTSCPGPGCVTTPTGALACSLGFTCTIPTGGSQAVECGAGSRCVGTCDMSCDVACSMGAVCEITMGDSSSSSCEGGSTLP